MVYVFSPCAYFAYSALAFSSRRKKERFFNAAQIALLAFYKVIEERKCYIDIQQGEGCAIVARNAHDVTEVPL